MAQIITKITRILKTEVVPTVVFYVFNVYTMSFELGALILFFFTFAGFGVLIFGTITESELGKKLQLFGRLGAHLSTLIMMIIMLSKICYVLIPG